MKTIVKLSAVTSIAVLFLLAMLQPFGIDQLKNDRLFFFSVETALVFSASVLSLLLARHLFHQDIDKVDCKSQLYKVLVVYNLTNLPLLSAFLLSFHSWFYCGSVQAGWYCSNGTFSLFNYLIVNMEVAIISLLLFVLQAYMLRNTQLLQELENMKTINALLEQRQEQYALQHVPSETENGQEPVREKCRLVGNSKNSVLEVAPDDIIYIESMANYADVCYMEAGTAVHKSLRITMKQLQETLSDAKNIVSPHRAFLVNLNFVVAVSGQYAVGYHLQMFGMEKEIPVSRANTKLIKERLNGEDSSTSPN